LGWANEFERRAGGQRGAAGSRVPARVAGHPLLRSREYAHLPHLAAAVRVLVSRFAPRRLSGYTYCESRSGIAHAAVALLDAGLSS
jgi:hypothetical protein